MGLFDFFKNKKNNNQGKVYTGMKGTIIESLKEAGDENIDLIEKVFDEYEPPKTKPIVEKEIDNIVGDMLDTGAMTSQLAHKYEQVEAINEKEIVVTLTAAEQELLTKFLTPTDIEYWFNQDYLSYWNSILPREIKEELKFFIENQILIEEKSLVYKLEYKSDAEMKKICKENGLKVSGSKNEKAIRIAENIPEIAEKIIPKKILYKCNSPVIELINSYKNKIANEQKELEEKFIDLCFKNEYQNAINAFCEWNKKLVFPHDAETFYLNKMLFELKIIMENIPKILDKIPENVLKDARAKAIISIIFNNKPNISNLYQTNFKYNLASCVYLLMNYARNCYEVYEARIRQKENPNWHLKFKVSCSCENACYECCIHNDKEFSLDNPPEIPNPNCKNENGCRCLIITTYK